MAAAAAESSVEIPFWIHRDKPPKWVSGIGLNTSCHDVLMSLASAVKNPNGEPIFNQDDVVAKRLVLVEEWRGVVKPLHLHSKIMKLWQAWGDERTQVKFVIKRASDQIKRRRKLRRRNSNSSATSRDEIHPNAQRNVDQQIQDLMSIIVQQGNAICQQLERLNESKVKSSQDVATHRDPASTVNNGNTAILPTEESEAKFERDMLILKTIHEELVKLCQMNEKLVFAEDSVDRLQIAVKQQQDQGADVQLSTAREELEKLKESNAKSSKEIEENKKIIANLESEFLERKSKLKHLEYDVNVIEKEGRKLARELDKVLSIQIEYSDVDEANESVETELCDLEAVEGAAGCKRTVGSPASSSSGNSSDKSRQTLTPELPELNESFFDPQQNSKKLPNKVDPEAENSDTGLSSLHSSSDEAVIDFGTLV